MAERLNPLLKRMPRILRLALLVLPMSGAQALEFPTMPLFVPGTVSPNIVVTLDDSGSMGWAFVPDLCFDSNDPNWALWDTSQAETSRCEMLKTRRFKSAFFNPLYYNPEVEYKPPKGPNGQQLSTSYSEPYINGFNTSAGKIQLNQYRPTAAYDPTTNGLHLFAENDQTDFPGNQNTGVLPYYYIFNKGATKAGGGTCDTASAQDRNDDACYKLIEVGGADDKAVVGGSSDNKKQNFANWYSFYRTRNLMTISAASLALEKMPRDFRVAWQALTSCKGFESGSCGSYNNRIARFDGSHRTDFFSWVQGLPAPSANDTPLRAAMKRAGEYFKLSGANSPYDNSPNDANDNSEYSCRPNYHVLMTDGYWYEFYDAGKVSSIDGNTSLNDYDSATRTLGDGTQYTARAPFRDGGATANSLSLADIAFYYWANDLRGTLTNNLPPSMTVDTNSAENDKWNPRNDPATWQHMVNFTVGLGLGVGLAETDLTWGGDTYSGSYAELLSGTKHWPTTANNAKENVSDLWHAAINSRGQFFSAETPTALQTAFDSIVASIESKSTRTSAASQNATRLSTDTFIYQASFDASDWSGTLTAYKLNATTGAIESTAWQAHSKLPDHASRKIFTWNPSTGGVEFQYANLSTSQQGALGGATILVDYLRGSDEHEKDGTYRTRANKLGDIINSDPIFVGDTDFGYDALPGASSGAASYLEFVSKTKPKRSKVIYVGANDGMLHGFKADTGVEALAYIPNEAILAQDSNGNYNLAQLKNTDYNHRFFVDASPFAGDAYFAPRNFGTASWKTVLASGMGSGGRAVFALDVTKPEDFAADKVLWEFTHANLGYTFGNPIIVRLNNGRWAAVFGNGYPDASLSSTATAKLFIVFLDADATNGWDQGVDYLVLDTNDQTGNGLSTPVAYDSNRDRVTDYLYAGDLKGNVWKINLSSADPGDWSVAYKDGTTNKPLFTATDTDGNAQPITTALELGRAPAGRSGLMVFFGTGRFVDKDDNKVANANTQSFYGIYDNTTAPASGRASSLQAQTVTEYKGQTFGTGDTAITYDVRVTSNTSVDYTNGKRGWYMDLPTQGERVVSQPLLRHGRVIFVTMIPSDDPCKEGGDSWLMELNAESGDQPDQSVFDFNLDDTFDYVTLANGDKVVASGVKSTVGIIDIPAVVTKETSEIKIAFGTKENASGDSSFRIGEAGGAKSAGRVSWREIIE